MILNEIKIIEMNDLARRKEQIILCETLFNK